MQSFQPYPPQRSAIPKVMGILMIIFASLGLLGTLKTLVGSSVPAEAYDFIPELKTWRTVELLTSLLGLGVGALHLLAGVRAVAYRDVAPKLATAYAAASIVSTLVGSTLVYVYLRPMLSSMMGDMASVVGPTMIVTSLVTLTWPVIVLILMTRPAARAACVNQAPGPVRLSLS